MRFVVCLMALCLLVAVVVGKRIKFDFPDVSVMGYDETMATYKEFKEKYEEEMDEIRDRTEAMFRAKAKAKAQKNDQELERLDATHEKLNIEFKGMYDDNRDWLEAFIRYKRKYEAHLARKQKALNGEEVFEAEE